MIDKPANTARRTRASVKEAIGKIMGDDQAIAEAAAEKAATKAKNHEGLISDAPTGDNSWLTTITTSASSTA